LKQQIANFFFDFEKLLSQRNVPKHSIQSLHPDILNEKRIRPKSSFLHIYFQLLIKTIVKLKGCSRTLRYKGNWSLFWRLCLAQLNF